MKSLYLFSYNVAMGLAWTVLLANVIFLHGFQAGPSVHFVKILQLLALMEVAHSAVGLTKSPIGSALSQGIGRLFTLYFGALACEATAHSTWFTAQAIVWSIGDITRYAFYASKVDLTSPSGKSGTGKDGATAGGIGGVQRNVRRCCVVRGVAMWCALVCGV